MADNLRGVIVGASTLLGKELVGELNADELNSSKRVWDIRLADAADSGGQLVAGGDEALIIQPLTPDVFDATDIAFFAESVPSTRAHWREAEMAKAAVVDLTGALAGEQGALVRSPWIEGGKAPNAETVIVIPAHPAAVILGVVGSRLKKAFGEVRLAATVLEPASQQGTRGMDELHQQTVNLLGFHSVPQELYDAQVAFNLQIGLGEAAKVDLSGIAETIRRDLRAVAGEAVSSSITMQLVQAPVFHGYTMSVFVELPDEARIAALRSALDGGVVKLTESAKDAPSNQSVTQEADIVVAIREDPVPRTGARGYWFWMAADNLKLTARHAVACADEIAAVRAVGKVQ
jgi:aspartate-semialdehyde dehydrogenase